MSRNHSWLGRTNRRRGRRNKTMQARKQLPLILLVSTAAAGIGSVFVGAFASMVLNICDPKFGCIFGIQFMVVLSSIAGLFLGILMICAFIGYTAVTGRVLAVRTTIQFSMLVAGGLGIGWSLLAFSTYR